MGRLVITDNHLIWHLNYNLLDKYILGVENVSNSWKSHSRCRKCFLTYYFRFIVLIFVIHTFIIKFSFKNYPFINWFFNHSLLYLFLRHFLSKLAQNASFHRFKRFSLPKIQFSWHERPIHDREFDFQLFYMSFLNEL